ncbi:hypothetical protein FC62_GL000554 [Amylolactobacillus amylotrophicus DSM 20534]|uniref:Uncharacterized protein n=3 Tax=Amylolactobacillus TaxID=2767876 RepID=A0A1L6XD65_9LACO|nr:MULTISPECIES: GtrA family protein [Amylolactobacillus]APT18885.1 hypothetical protein LA20533_06315 [Amylolactobacillus amylophilus DSM 20533 = JCM 1125]KRK38862.1 hypothetical protein FC62_GL000554 [Amylolactobacillus amylotrophicus DSM 20534]KRM42495.1 hypothetical protein FD40_GL000286 [Amylolactobacillus amylophilus DSM 20533 = JCM 1125]GED80085.1 membrane protein [Amylolactobacillus amylophilus]
MEKIVGEVSHLFHKYQELISYAFFGVLTTLVNIVSFFLLQQFSSGHYLVNNTIAWFISVLFAFVTNKLFVFNSKSWAIKLVIKEIILFFGTRFATLIVDDGIMALGVSILGISSGITKIIDQVIVIALNFVLSKLSFKPKQTK